MIFRLLVYPVLILFCTACSGPGYYIQAFSGQWKLMHARQDVQSLLDNPETSPELSADLRTANQIRAFADSTLYLPSNNSYSSYVEVDGEAVVWNVIATEEFSLQPRKWCFPIAGCVPYRGFFKQQKALEFAAGLSTKGMDVYVSPAAAYSTLGWFNDPLLSTMLSGSDIHLAAYLFHELAHQRLYIKGDGQFNEAYASFVEQTGVMAWLESKQRQDEILQWQQLQNASGEFTDLIREVHNELAGLYQSKQAETIKREQKAEIFLGFLSSYERLSVEKWHGRRYYNSWFKDPLNNAKLALYDTYEGSQCAFKGLLNQAEGNLREFHRMAEQKSKLQKNKREQWLKQSCDTFVPPISVKKS